MELKYTPIDILNRLGNKYRTFNFARVGEQDGNPIYTYNLTPEAEEFISTLKSDIEDIESYMGAVLKAILNGTPRDTWCGVLILPDKSNPIALVAEVDGTWVLLNWWNKLVIPAMINSNLRRAAGKFNTNDNGGRQWVISLLPEEVEAEVARRVESSNGQD